MCTNNTNPCNQDPCGCKIKTSELVYQGPNLDCTGVTNCQSFNDALAQIDAFICSDSLIQTIITNITNNYEIHQEFITLVNISVDCNTVQNCITTTTTTTMNNCNCYQMDIEVLQSVLDLTYNNKVELIYTDCDGKPVSIDYGAAGIYSQDCVDLSLDVILRGYTEPGGTLINFYFPSTINQPCCI